MRHQKYYLSPGLKSLVELVPSLLIGTGEARNLSLAARILAALSDSLVTAASASTELVGASTVDTDLSKYTGLADINFVTLGTMTSDICLKTGKGFGGSF